MKTTTYKLPTHWAAYFINGDATGYDDEELQAINDWQADHPDESCLDVANDAAFMFDSLDDCELGCERATFTFTTHED